MDASNLSQRLSRITTCWSLVFQAHQGPQDEVAVAQQALVQRYGRAIYRYLLGAVRDADAADDLSQEFVLRLVRGDFHRADPGRGRFRDFLKTALFHLVIDYQKSRLNSRQPLPLDTAFPAAPDPGPVSEQEFLQRWRQELLDRTWEALAEIEKDSGQLFYTVLRFRAENVDLRSAQMAAQLSERLGKPLTDAGVRQSLHRAREKFADLLLQEVACSLQTPDRDRLEQELIDLDLLSYCRSALDRYRS
jgi:RNA polymerase sigma-70 factor (ECF subfamily)